MQNNTQEKIRGIAGSNPVEVEKEYLLYLVEYAAKRDFNHLQIVGPIHDHIRGNIDGMTFYRKYRRFNDEKDSAYVEQAMEAVNEACMQAVKYGIKTYVWHHELELPADFGKVYPSVLNDCGDIEVTHPLVKDFLEHKIQDFFHAYPDVHGIILTLHETKIPLLKLQNQKLNKTDRVKYVTKILYDVCQSVGKELIVRPFASLKEDYVMMAQAYEEISKEMLIMDKWTQFDWSLCLPHNAFYHNIKQNPLLVEADIFGEFFGKGHLPIMLKDHLREKFAYCSQFSPRGYVARIDRAGQIPFGDVNEVNITMTQAYLEGLDADQEAEAFFRQKYPKVFREVREIMEQTEEIVRKIIYVKGYYFTQLSLFPSLNHCKNHYYFEMMRRKYRIDSNEWYIPENWDRGTLQSVLDEKQTAMSAAADLYEKILELESCIEQEEYQKLRVKFYNLKLVAEIWMQLVRIFMDYVKYFETHQGIYEERLEKDVRILLEKNREGTEVLGDQFYCSIATEVFGADTDIENFAIEILRSFQLEKQAEKCVDKSVLDYVVCGGAMEGHKLQKEVNFSDTLMRGDSLCRIPGNSHGEKWSSINAHGWFSYELRVKSGTKNCISVWMESLDEILQVRVTMGEKEHVLCEESGRKKKYFFCYDAAENEETVRIRFDKVSAHIPCVFMITVEAGER